MKPLIAGALGLLSCAGLAAAGETPLHATGRVVEPLDDVPVWLEAVDVRIVLSDSEVEVSSMFFLTNEGHADTVRTGFRRGCDADIEEFEAIANEPLAVETVTDEPVRNAPETELPWWKVFNVPLPDSGKTIDVLNRFRTAPQPVGESELSDRAFTYVLRSGSAWRGTVAHVSVKVYLVNLIPEQFTEISPAGYLVANNLLTWRFTNIEPGEDIRLRFMRHLPYYRWETAEKVLEDDPENAHAHYLLGTVRFVRSEPGGEGWDDARSAFLAAVENDPHHLEARWFLATMYFLEGNLPGAREQLEAIADDDPDFTIDDEAFPSWAMEAVPGETAGAWLRGMKSGN